MKKHLIIALAFVCGLGFLSSCMKNDPENNETVFYGYQQIPNINEYMPRSLLLAMGENSIHFGDEPPKIEGFYIADSTYSVESFFAPESNWVGRYGLILGTREFDFNEQHVGTSGMDYKFYINTLGVEKSTTDTTSRIMKNYLEAFINDTISPAYFKNPQNNFKVFDKVYIIGKDSKFTIYYYDIRLSIQQSQVLGQYLPLYANIISGRVEKVEVVETDTVSGTTTTIEKNVIRDFKWGMETMRYLIPVPNDPPLYMYNMATTAKPGDGCIIESQYVQEMVN